MNLDAKLDVNLDAKLDAKTRCKKSNSHNEEDVCLPARQLLTGAMRPAAIAILVLSLRSSHDVQATDWIVAIVLGLSLLAAISCTFDASYKLTCPQLEYMLPGLLR